MDPKEEMEQKAAEEVNPVLETETPAQQETEAAPEEEKKNSGSSSRRYLVWVIAGVYLIYTAYELCKNVINGEEGTGPAFLAAGIAFGIIGAVMCVAGIKGFIKMSKEKKAEEERLKTENPKPASGPAPEGKKSMSIAERARLAERLKDEDTPEE